MPLACLVVLSCVSVIISALTIGGCDWNEPFSSSLEDGNALVTLPVIVSVTF